MSFFEDDEWFGAHEQITAECQAEAGPFSDEDEWHGVHEQWSLEQEAGVPTMPEYELFAMLNADERCFVWSVKERQTH